MTGITGRWRFTDLDNWEPDDDDDDFEPFERGFIQFGSRCTGSMAFPGVEAELDCLDGETDGSPSVDFTWRGLDEGEDACGRGWAILRSDGRLEGYLYIHMGESSSFLAERLSG